MEKIETGKEMEQLMGNRQANAVNLLYLLLELCKVESPTLEDFRKPVNQFVVYQPDSGNLSPFQLKTVLYLYKAHCKDKYPRHYELSDEILKKTIVHSERIYIDDQLLQILIRAKPI
ncbi:MAG: hypothetical protein ABIA91_02980 [Patescibacteria group bacterium]